MRRTRTVYVPSTTSFATIRPQYGFWNFVLDVVMLTISSGFWAFWILFREIRKNRAV